MKIENCIWTSHYCHIIVVMIMGKDVFTYTGFKNIFNNGTIKLIFSKNAKNKKCAMFIEKKMRPLTMLKDRRVSS